jgi:hypothetical protein
MKASSPFGLLTVADQEQENICSAYLRHWNSNRRPNKICRPQKKRASIQQAKGIDIMRTDRTSLKRHREYPNTLARIDCGAGIVANRVH